MTDTRREWFDSHAVHEQLAAFRAAVDAWIPSEDSPPALAASERAGALISHLESTFAATDVVLVAPRPLDTVEHHLITGTGAIDQLASVEDAAQLDALHVAIDGASEQSASIPLMLDPDLARMRTAAASYRQSVSQLSSRVYTELDAASAAIDVVHNRADSVDDEIIEKARSVGVAIESQLAPVAAQVADIVQTVDAQKARLDTAIAAFQAQFSEAEAKRAEQFTAAAAKLQSEHGDFVKAEQQAAAESQAAQIAQAQATLENLERHEVRARRLVSRTGAEAVSGGHVGYANEQKKSADRWRSVGMLLIGAAAVYGFASLGLSGGVAIDVQWIAGRLLVALPLLGLGLYALSQSGHHREVERLSRETELDLQALDPFIELLPEADRDALKAEMTRKAFFRERAAIANADPGLVKDLLKIISEAVSKR